MMQGLNIWVSGASEGFQSWDACIVPITLTANVAEGWEVWVEWQIKQLRGYSESQGKPWPSLWKKAPLEM